MLARALDQAGRSADVARSLGVKAQDFERATAQERNAMLARALDQAGRSADVARSLGVKAQDFERATVQERNAMLARALDNQRLAGRVASETLKRMSDQERAKVLDRMVNRQGSETLGRLGMERAAFDRMADTAKAAELSRLLGRSLDTGRFDAQVRSDELGRSVDNNG